MNYSETIQYLYSRLPMFSKIGAAAIKADLTNTLQLCSRLDDPHKKFKTIHVGGTNGKGSTSHMLAAILQVAGYKTGLYTSPHLRDFRERIRVNGEMISEENVIAFVNEQKENIEQISPSFFEVTVAMAFDHFAKQNVDIAVIEVGLGGRLDSTNIITPVLSVITNIGYDHMNILGNSLKEIAFEKAGIIKSQVPVVIGERQKEIDDVFIKKADECDSPIIFASEQWQIIINQTHGTNDKYLDIAATHNLQPITYNLHLDLTGTYQLKNVKTVLSAVIQLQKQGFKITTNHLQSALKQVSMLTGLMGRWQTLSSDPMVICDTGHNEDGIREVLKNIDATHYEKLHMVIGMVRDKDVNKVLTLLPDHAVYYFCHPAIERAKPAEELMNEAKLHGLHGKSYPSVKEALKAAKRHASSKDLVFVGGSTFVVAEVV
ncbi:MAG TPA: folylpolyglutamate synthase/dihydrofolate synthase family protein [Sphingobacteriaceae bacterium]